MLSLDAARQLLADAVKSLAPVEVPLDEAHDLRLAAAVHADIDLPHWEVSAMDGYAVRWVDLVQEKPLPVAFEVSAGEAPPPLPEGQACRIFTGAVLPSGADTVIPQEEAEILADKRAALSALPRGSHVRARGEVLQQGALLGHTGDLLTPGMIALLAAGGASRVSVVPRPRVALLTTGFELVRPDQQPVLGAVRDSNTPMLKALIRQARFSLVQHLTASDELTETCAMLEQAVQGADMVVTSGGVSVGDWDFIPRAVQEIGGEILYHKVALKPGKPVLAARIGKTWLLGLPGNPVSVLVCWRLFALPLGLTLSGEPTAFAEKPRAATLTAIIGNDENRTLLSPAIIHQKLFEPAITPLPWKGSHDIASAARATALLRLEVGEHHQTGDKVVYYPLD